MHTDNEIQHLQSTATSMNLYGALIQTTLTFKLVSNGPNSLGEKTLALIVSIISRPCLDSVFLLVARMLLVVRPGAPSSVLAPSNTARSP